MKTAIKSLNVTQETFKKINLIKYKLNFKSVDETLRYLINLIKQPNKYKNESPKI